jgi:hypothetical protein
MVQINKNNFTEPVSVNDRWWFALIKELVERTKFGTIELEITLKNSRIATIKEHTRKAHSFYNP